MTVEEILEMIEALEVDETYHTPSQDNFPGLEAFCLLLARLRSPGNMYDLTMQYDRAQSAISFVINEIITDLDQKWEHILDLDEERLLRPSQLVRYAEAIHRKGAPLERVFGFIDCTIRRISRPTWFQRQAYNGHKKFHALKFQALVLPNGLFAHLYGPFEGRRNDNFLLSDSKLLDRLERFAYREDLPADAPIEHRTFQIFGDPAYGVGPFIQSPFAGVGVRTVEEQEWNAEMSAVRIEVEHAFGIVQNTFPFLNAGWKMHLYSSPVGRYYRVGVLLTNCLNCLHPNQVATYFDCPPPTLQDYLHR